MTTEEKIQRLAQLFKQRDAIQTEIESLIGLVLKKKTKAPILNHKKLKPAKNESVTCLSKGRRLTPVEKQEIKRLQDEGLNSRQVAEKLKISVGTVNRYWI